jgi:hypothetical protein
VLVVRVGVAQAPRELEVELADDANRDALVKSVESALGQADGVLWLEDRKGRRIAFPAARIAYVEIGAPGEERRVGFGAP